MMARASAAGKRRHLVLQLRELLGDIIGQQVAPRGQRLAELHEDRAELLECQAQPLGARARRAMLKPGPPGNQEDEAQRAVQVRGAHQIVEPVAHQHALYLDQPQHDAQPHQIRAPAPSARAARPPAPGRASRASRRSSCSRGLLHAAQEMLGLVPGYQLAALVGRDIRRGCAPRSMPPSAPIPGGARRSHEQMRGAAADDSRQACSRSGASSVPSSRKCCASCASPSMRTSPRWMGASGSAPAAPAATAVRR